MSIRVSEIAREIDAKLIGNDSVTVVDISPIQDSTKGHITFISNKKYAKYLSETKASAVIISEDLDVEAIEGKTLLQVKNPYFAFSRVIKLFYPDKLLIEKGIHTTAVIGKNSKTGQDVSLGAHVVIGRGCSIGDRTVLMPGVVVGDESVIGADCKIYSNVSIREKVTIKNRVIIHNGSVIGSDGFGFAYAKGKYHKIPQIGTVVIEDDVEIGANTTIDRAALGKTVISKGTKLDNLIQVAHNCRIGEHCVIASQTGISGSTTIGNRVQIGGQAGFAGHIKIGDNAIIAAQSGVTKSINGGKYVFGTPANDYREEFRIHAARRRLPELLKDVVNIKKTLKKLEKNRGKDV
ncbi:MAG: UDP-3-O-(3-hydroxymyristoyl)glucosamine N-acyltransferase [bacterium]